MKLHRDPPTRSSSSPTSSTSTFMVFGTTSGMIFFLTDLLHLTPRFIWGGGVQDSSGLLYLLVCQDLCTRYPPDKGGWKRAMSPRAAPDTSSSRGRGYLVLVRDLCARHLV